MEFKGGESPTSDPTAPRADGGTVRSTIRFLIVDDSPVIRLTLTQALIRQDIDPTDISEAETFHEAVEEFDVRRPDVVFLDVSLPEGHPRRSGPGSFVDYLLGPAANDSVAKAVVTHMLETNPRVKIVLCTGNSPDDPKVQELLVEGVQKLLQKPIDPAEIGEVVRTLRSGPS